jgi:predicted nucleic acid-binding protein
MTSAVGDSGPLTHLWQIDQWRAFRTFHSVHLAAQVAREVSAHVDLDQMTSLSGRDVTVHDVPETEIEAARSAAPAVLRLQEADLATLALAARLKPDLVLTDDLATRQAVEAMGQTPMGSVGVVLRAYKAGLLDSEALGQAIDGLFVHSTLYLSPNFRVYVLGLIEKMMAQ